MKDNWKIKLFRFLQQYDTRFWYLKMNEIDYQYGRGQHANLEVTYSPIFWGNLWGYI